MSQELVLSLHPGQAAIFNSPARFKVCAAGRRFGKTHLAAAMLSVHGLEEVNSRGYKITQEHPVYYIAPTFEQAKRVIWPKLREMLGFVALGGFIKNENTNDGWVELVNGHRIYIRGADNPDSLRGISPAFIVMDEYADMKPYVWHEIIEPALMDVEAGALFIGTPKGKNHFYKMFMGALEHPKDAEGNDLWDDWESFHFSSTDNPFLKEKELKRMMKGGNRPLEVIKQELNASFISGGAKVLKPEWFPVIPRVDPGMGSIFITVDLAGFKKQEAGKKILTTDETVIAITLVYEDQWYVLKMLHGHWTVRETCKNIIWHSRKYAGCRLGIEAGALLNACGDYLEEYMRSFSRYINPEPLTHGGVRKIDRIQWALQGRGERGKICIVTDAAEPADEKWNAWFLDQVADFPDPLAHDDGIDALAYVDQMAQSNFHQNIDTYETGGIEDLYGDSLH